MTKHEWKVGDQARYMGSYEEMKSLVGQDVVIHELLCQSLISIRFSNGYMYWVNPNCLEPIPSPKDPFAPGEYVTSIHDYVGVFGFIKNIRHIYKISGQSRPDTFENEGGFVLQKSDFRPATPEEIAAYKEKYEPECADGPEPGEDKCIEGSAGCAPEPRITFTVGGQEFYVGQRVWSLVESEDFWTILGKGDELEIRANLPNSGQVVCSLPNDPRACLFDVDQFTTIPPATQEWKFGDVALHKEHGVGIVTSWASSQYAIEVTTRASNQIWVNPFELTFLRRADLSV